MDLFLDYQAAEVATSLCGEPATLSLIGRKAFITFPDFCVSAVPMTVIVGGEVVLNVYWIPLQPTMYQQ